MASLFKPLFNDNVLKAKLTGFGKPSLSPEQSAVVQAWASTAANPAFRFEKEKPHQGKFLSDIFGTLLGYHLLIGHMDDYHLKQESASTETKGGKTPDARLGSYGPDRDRTRVVIELKAPGAELDAKQGAGYGGLTPVEQAFGYLPKFDDCRWVIVSNFQALSIQAKFSK